MSTGKTITGDFPCAADVLRDARQCPVDDGWIQRLVTDGIDAGIQQAVYVVIIQPGTEGNDAAGIAGSA